MISVPNYHCTTSTITATMNIYLTRTPAPHIAEATQTRANLRAVLKENKRTQDSEKDYLRLIKVLDDYLPQLYGIMSSVASSTVSLRFEPVFSWRTTLSSQLLNTCPRVPLPSLHADLAFSLLTYGMALSNFARLTVNALGYYEHDSAISAIERHTKDEKLNFAVSLLCRASGVFAYLSESALADWNNAGASGPRPPDLTTEVCAALSKMALADAQALAIRKLLSLSANESTLSPGPPLPKSHPSAALLAKLHLECASLYISARSLALTPGKVRTTRNAASESGIGASGEVTGELTRHLTDEAAFHSALAHKWLGVDAGERGVAIKGGEAVGFLAWAKRELEDLCGSFKGTLLRKDRMSGEDRRGKKERVILELASVEKMNDSVCVVVICAGSLTQSFLKLSFQPVPKQSDLQTRIPAGRLAVSPKPYEPPIPALLAHTVQNLDVPRQTASDTDSDSDSDKEVVKQLPSRKGYTGAGSYF
ncbi:hypothetical protein BKA83DRAFT_4282756 [Pisolithus microcarpus]|nr:hypothetical protein BKA83DRAFT_4282756 [Pisolithus microcarpus]